VTIYLHVAPSSGRHINSLSISLKFYYLSFTLLLLFHKFDPYPLVQDDLQRRVLLRGAYGLSSRSLIGRHLLQLTASPWTAEANTRKMAILDIKLTGKQPAAIELLRRVHSTITRLHYHYDNSLVVTITVTCYLWAPSSGDHLFTCGTIFRPPQYISSTSVTSWVCRVTPFDSLFRVLYLVMQNRLLVISWIGRFQQPDNHLQFGFTLELLVFPNTFPFLSFLIFTSLFCFWKRLYFV